VGRNGAILIDVSAVDEDSIDRSFFQGIGHPVLVCHGPPRGSLCPILMGKDCSFIDAAHGVIFELDLDRQQHRAILERYKAIVSDQVPLRVVIRPGQEEEHAEFLDGVEVWTERPSRQDLDGFVASVDAFDHVPSGEAASR
jgi:hypothetical protein